MNNSLTIRVPHTRRRFFKIDEADKATNKAINPQEKKVTEIPVVYITPKVTQFPQMNKHINPLLTYESLNHHDGRLFIHVWSDKNVVAVTSKDVTFNTTSDYMVMIMRFPFASKGQYYATATSFIDTGFSNFSFIDHIEELAELELD